MAWGRCKYDAALHWSATAVLDGCIEVLVAFLVLVCTVLNFVTSSFIRVSGFHIPCSCCTHYQKSPSGNVVETCENALVSRKQKPISAPVVSEVGLSDIRDHSDEYSRESELNRPSNSSKIYAIIESDCGSPLEVFSEEGEEEGAASESASAQRSEQVIENFNDRSQEDVDRDQYAKDQELLHALQSERETMAALYSELEEERNSSATAASEALAMISRLQEEKAAVQMESRQFQRMVMEKAMYDQEAIEVLKEILAKREEERIALEEEVRLYKDRLDGLLMEVRESVERVGRDYAPMLLLEGTTLEDKLASPKFERAELLMTERISPGRLAKDEEVEFLDRLNKTKSQLLTALLQEGIPEPASAFVESVSFANEIHEAMAKIPARAESLPILEHDSQKAPLGPVAIKTGREIGLPIPPPKVPKKDSVKDDGEAADKPVSASGASDLPAPAIAEEQTEKALAEDDGKAADEPVFPSRGVDVPAPPFAAVKKENEKKLLKDDGKAAAKPELNSLLSLKRRWSARGSQEVSAETLAKAKEDRRIEEKRLSVLEYVRNLEEQLQQQAGRPPAQLTRARSVGGREQDDRFKTPAQYESSTVSESSGSSGRLESDDLVQRRLFADGGSLEKELNMNSFQDESDDRTYARQYSFSAGSDGKFSNDDGEFYANAGKSEESPDETLFVHDVYEVQNHPNAAQSKFGVWVAGTMSGLEMQSPISDRLGKPDNLNVEEEHSRNSNERDGQFLSNAVAFPQEDEDSGSETQWKNIQRTQYKDLCISTSLRKDNSRSLVEEEVEQLTYRLKALEADRYIMKQTIDSLRRENGEMKLIQEIAQQLRELRGMEQNEMQLMDVSPHTLQFQVGVAQAGPSTSKKRRFNSTPKGSSCRPGTPGSGLGRASSRSLLDLCTEGGNFTPYGVVS
ncbi:hypothetical protein M758_2G108400 [Ceratodon purpureus]|nr:hypothetical protein M758_2G108400 [Ceratodon purpureus]